MVRGTWSFSQNLCPKVSLSLHYCRTFTFGTGVPIHNGMSPLIILVMAIMFGVLMVIILISCVICAIKKFSRKEQGADIAYSRMDT